MMKVLFLAVLTLVVSIVVAFDAVGRGGTASGRFQYNGMQCKWFEGRPTNSIRSLTIQCGGRNGFSTTYQGNPHPCSWYRSGNQYAYYVSLVNALKRANFDVNSPYEITSSGHCQEIVFRKTGIRLLRLLKKINN